METLNIILDTTVYRSDRNFFSKEFSLLKDLVRQGLVVLHVPDVVKRESITQNTSDILENLKSANKYVKKLRGKGLHESHIEEVEKLENGIANIERVLQSSVTRHWEDFLRNNNCLIHKVKAEHGSSVVNNYFNGDDPFRKVKSKDDFPDAFIYENVYDITIEYSECIFISNDYNLRTSVNSKLNATVFAELSNLISSKEFLPYKALHDPASSIDSIEARLTTVKSLIEGQMLTELERGYPNIEIPDSVFNESMEPNIVGIERISISEWVAGKTSIADRKVYMQAIVNAEALVEYFIYHSDYLEITEDPKQRRVYAQPWNKRVMYAEETMVVAIQVDFHINMKDLDDPEVEGLEAEVLNVKPKYI